MSNLIGFLTGSAVMVQAWLALGLATTFSIFLYIFFRVLIPACQKKEKVWLTSLLVSLRRPLQIYIWVLAFTYVTIAVSQLLHVSSKDLLVFEKFKLILFLGLLLWFVMQFVGRVEQAYIEGRHAHAKKIKDKTQVSAIAQIIRVVFLILLLLTALPLVGVQVSAFLTFGGVAGVVLGFAAKDTLANFLGGLMVYWDRPFSVGDWIRSPDKSIEGTVKKIGWRLTQIVTFDKRPLYVPNAFFSQIAVENPSRMSNRRIKTTIGVRYEDASKVRGMLKVVEDMLKNHPEIDTNQTLMVNLFEFGPSSLNFYIYTFTKTTKWAEFEAIRQDVLLKILDIIDDHGAACAFPTRTLHFSAEDGKMGALLD